MHATRNLITNGYARFCNALNTTNGKRATIAIGSAVSLAGLAFTVKSGIQAGLQCVQEQKSNKMLTYAFDFLNVFKRVDLVYPSCRTLGIYTAAGATITIGALFATGVIARRHFAKPPAPPKPGLAYPKSRANVVKGSEQDIALTLKEPVTVVGQKIPKNESTGCIIS